MRCELPDEQTYRANIAGIRLQIPELQAEDKLASKIREKGLKQGWEEIDGVLDRESRLYLPEIMRTEIISRQPDDPLAGHFGVEKTRKLVAQKYNWPTLRVDIKAYVKGCNVCITSKTIKHDPYGEL